MDRTLRRDLPRDPRAGSYGTLRPGRQAFPGWTACMRVCMSGRDGRRQKVIDVHVKSVSKATLFVRYAASSLFLAGERCKVI